MGSQARRDHTSTARSAPLLVVVLALMGAQAASAGSVSAATLPVGQGTCLVGEPWAQSTGTGCALLAPDGRQLRRPVASPADAGKPYATAASAGGGAPLTKAQATAFANSVNLTAADVPGFKLAPAHKKKSKTPAEKELGRELSRCVDVAPSKDVVNVKSKAYELETNTQQESVHSSVSVKPTSGLAAKELAVVHGSRARNCLAHYLNLEFKGPQFRGVTVSPVSIKQSTPSAPGAAGSFAVRITVSITAHGIRVPIYFDLLGFVYGPAQVALFTSGLAAPFPAATEQRLFSLLLARAKAQVL